MSDLSYVLDYVTDEMRLSIEYLWPMLVKKTVIDWLATTITTSVIWIVSLALELIFIKKAKTSTYIYEKIPPVIICLMLFLAFTAILIFQFCNISQLLCPEAATFNNYVNKFIN